MVQTEEIIEQRDRFLAFSFAASDLLMEIDAEDRVSFASGAVKHLTGLDDKSIKGRIWTDIFVEADKLLLRELVRNASPGKRCGPILVTIQDNSRKKTVSALFMAMKMPDTKALYMTLAFPNPLMSVRGEELRRREQENSLISKDEFIKAAQKAIQIARESGQEIGMTLLEIPDMKAMKNRMSPDAWTQMRGLMANLLKAKSVDGQTATQLSENRYSLLHDKSIDAQSIQAQIALLMKEADPEGRTPVVTNSTIAANMDSLNEKEVSRALMYTLNAYEKKGANLNLQSLDDSFKGFLAENTRKIQNFKQMTVHMDFYLQFQPIVHLSNLGIGHYEILTRFKDGSTPYELITFGEEVGLATDFDMAVCTQAVRYISKLPVNANNKFALNISGQSIENEQFMADLRRNISGNKALPNMLMFEITESANIKNLEKVNKFITVLRKDGFEVCLDDFGAGSASFQYLHQLHVDFVKLDGIYVQHILDNVRDRTMVKHLVELCRELKVGVVAERIETEEEAVFLRNMNVDYGQGYWFAKALQRPDYAVDEAKLKKILAAAA